MAFSTFTIQPTLKHLWFLTFFLKVKTTINLLTNVHSRFGITLTSYLLEYDSETLHKREVSLKKSLLDGSIIMKLGKLSKCSALEMHLVNEFDERRHIESIYFRPL